MPDALTLNYLDRLNEQIDAFSDRRTHGRWRAGMATASRHYSFYDAGAYPGETEHRIMVSFWSMTDTGEARIGQSELVLASEFPAYQRYVDANGWSAASLIYPSARYPFEEARQ